MRSSDSWAGPNTLLVVPHTLITLKPRLTAGQVHVSREVKGTVGYGQDGYRADCRHYPFNQARAPALPHPLRCVFVCESVCV
eukprot:1570843-Rhodomonas_salina.1